MPKKAASLSEVPDEFMRCRAFRKHPEIQVHDTVIRNARNKVIAFVRREACPLCEGGSETLYGLPGWNIVWRRRLYPDYYQIEGGADATELKDEYIRRMGGVIDEEDEDEAALMLDRRRRREEREREKAKAAKKTAAASKSTKRRTTRRRG